MVRKTEPKPLRVFMEDGVHDEWSGCPEIGDWWLSNQTMNRAPWSLPDTISGIAGVLERTMRAMLYPSSRMQCVCFGADGSFYTAWVNGDVEVTLPNDVKVAASIRAHGLVVHQLTIRNNGDMYVVTETRNGKNELWFAPSKGDPKRQDKDLKAASGLAL